MTVESSWVLFLLGWALAAAIQLVLARVGKGEDERYRELRARWEARGNVQGRFFVFFQAQAFLAALLSLPILLAAANPDSLGALAWAGAALWLVAAEASSLRSRGEEYRRYQRCTSAFVPWVPKRVGA